MAAAAPAAAAVLAAGAGPSGAGASVEEAVLAVCRQHEQGLSQDQLAAALPNIDVQRVAESLNALLSRGRIQLYSAGAGGSSVAAATPVFKFVKPEELVKFKGLSHDEMLVFQLIQQSGNMGIWTKDLKIRSNLQQPQINKCLKSLEGRKLIKAVKSVASSNRKVYMLFELEPSREITGGAWYTGHEYDSEFIAVLRQECHKYIKREKRATLDMMCDFVRNTRLSKVELGVEEVLQIVNTLVYDGKVDAHESRRDNGAPYTEGTVFYTPAALPLQEHSDFTLVPCGICPVAAECHEGGVISPATCVYFDTWLRFDEPAPMQT